MKRFRFLAVAAAVLVGMVLVAAVVAFNSSFQTWMVRRQLAGQPGVRATVGRVSAGLQRIELRNLRFEWDGLVLTIPSLEADVSLIAAGLQDRVDVSRLTGKGWTLDLSNSPTASAAGVRSEPAAGGAIMLPPTAEKATVQAFAGIFSHLNLPVALSVDGVDLEGDVILPASRGRIKATLQGGGLRDGQEGKFDVVADATLTDPAVSSVIARSVLRARMETARAFGRITVRIDAEAKGTRFPNGVKLVTEVSAGRAAVGETYTASVVTQEREIFRLQAAYPPGAPRLEGAWKLDVRSVEVAPFAFGQPLPDFTAMGEGRFDADASFNAIHATGRLNGAADRLAVVASQLSGIETLKYAAEFDVARRGAMVTVETLMAEISATQPVARVRALQKFEFNPATAELKAADPAGDLVAISLLGVPMTWAKPLLKDIAVSGGELRGELVATPRDGGVAVRSTAPVGISTFSIAQGAKALARDVVLALNLSADYTPRGWQAEVSALTLKSGATSLITLDAKAGQLSGANQALKTTGRFSADLPAWLQQPIAAGAVALTRGSAVVEFAASLGAKQEIQAKIALGQLAADAKPGLENLPSLAADVRADIAPDGKLAINAPLVLERSGRKSDILLAGTVATQKTNRVIEARLSSDQLVLDDVKLLAGLIPAQPAPKEAAPLPQAMPPWAGITGSIALQLKKVVYSETFEATNVGGTLRIEGGALKLETVRAGLGEAGEAKLAGTVIFDASLPQPYALAADFAVTEFDPGPLFRASAPNQLPTLEGRFNIVSKLAGRATTLGDLALGAGGDFQLTSRGGVFRGLPANVANLTETTGRIAGFINSLGARGGKKDEDIANKAQAVAEFARALGHVAFDQLSVVILRDTALNTVLKDFTLISPELRLTGAGETNHRPGTALLDDGLSMEFKLRARGRQGDLLRYLGLLEGQADDFGYAACMLPLKVDGTLRRPLTGELNQRLASIALEKSGILDRLRGNGK